MTKHPVKRHRSDWTVTGLYLHTLAGFTCTYHRSERAQQVPYYDRKWRYAGCGFEICAHFVVHTLDSRYVYIYILTLWRGTPQSHAFRCFIITAFAAVLNEHGSNRLQKKAEWRKHITHFMPVIQCIRDNRTLFQLFSSFTQDLIWFSPLQVYNLRKKYCDSEPTDCLSKMEKCTNSCISPTRVGRLFNRFFL